VYLITAYGSREKLNECLTDRSHVFVYEEIEFVEFGKGEAWSLLGPKMEMDFGKVKIRRRLYYSSNWLIEMLCYVLIFTAPTPYGG